MDLSELEGELARLHPASFGWAVGCARGDRAEAEEVLQTVYLKILEGKARFGGRSSLKTWLFGVIRKTAAERRRRDFFRRGGIERLVAASVPARAHPDPEGRLAGAEGAGRLREALIGLPKRQREALDLVFYHELTVEEAARVMGVSLGSARTHYARGKDRLRALLGEKEGR